MSRAVVERLRAAFGDRILGTSDFRGDEEVLVASKDWAEVAEVLKKDDAGPMSQFIDLTAVDHPMRADGRFDVLLLLRSMQSGERIRVRTRLAEGQPIASLSGLWAGANWAEREVWDMFGIRFEGHPDLRRILLYDEFEGFPLRKDYPIDKAQPLVPYRDTDSIQKLPPFGIEEGQPFARIDWEARMAGGDRQVSPAIGLQQGQRRTLSDSEAAEALKRRLAERAQAASEAEGKSEE